MGPLYLHQVRWTNTHHSRGTGGSIGQGSDSERGSSQADAPIACIEDERYPLLLERPDEEPLHTSEDPELSESSIAWGGGGSRSMEESPHRVGVTCGVW